ATSYKSDPVTPASQGGSAVAPAPTSSQVTKPVDVNTPATSYKSDPVTPASQGGSVVAPAPTMTYFYSADVTIETPDGKTVSKQQKLTVNGNGSGPTEADVANLSFNSIELPSIDGYTPEVTSDSPFYGTPMATIDDTDGHLTLVFPKIQPNFISYDYKVTYKKNVPVPVTEQVGQQFDVQFPLSVGNIQINDQNAYYYKTSYRNIESSDNGKTWTPVSYDATPLSTSLGGSYRNAQTGYITQGLPEFKGYTPFISAVFVRGSEAYDAEATALLNQLTAQIEKDPYDIPAYTLNLPLDVIFRVSYMTNTWQELDVHFNDESGNNDYYYKTNSEQTMRQNVNGNSWEPVSYKATSLVDALKGTYTYAETGASQELPTHYGRIPYLSSAVIAYDPTYETESTDLLNKLMTAIKENPYEIPAYTLTVPLDVSFNVDWKDAPTPSQPATPTKDTDQNKPQEDQPTDNTSKNVVPGTVEGNKNKSDLPNKVVTTGNNGNGLNVQTTTVANDNNHSNKQALPQTGNTKNNTAAIAGLGLASLTAMLGLGGLKKKND
ncbi:LPXTG cell wall anchor domain-containing protein, partial [Limosilactobacillus fastidiosus]